MHNDRRLLCDKYQALKDKHYIMQFDETSRVLTVHTNMPLGVYQHSSIGAFYRDLIIFRH